MISSRRIVLSLWTLWGMLLWLSMDAAVPLKWPAPLLCGRYESVFRQSPTWEPDRAYLLQSERNRIFMVGRQRFPFALSHRQRRFSDRHQLRAVDLTTGKTVFVYSPERHGAPVSISTIVPWRDQLIVWGAAQDQKGKRHYARFLVGPNGEGRPFAASGQFNPLLSSRDRNLLFSLEERPTIIGAQPQEHELPPQQIRIESLSEAPGGEHPPSRSIPVRRLLKLFEDPQGNLYILRWEGEQKPPYYEFEYVMILEKRSPPDYQMAWLTPVNPTPIVTGRLPRFKLDYQASTRQIWIDYDDWERSSSGNDFVHRKVAIDTGTGAASDTQTSPAVIHQVKSPSVELPHGRFVISTKPHRQGYCLSLLPEPAAQ